VLPLLLCAWFVVVVGCTVVSAVLDALVVAVVVVLVLLPLAGTEQPHFVTVELSVGVMIKFLEDYLPLSTSDDG
jgi:hypothetical protein